MDQPTRLSLASAGSAAVKPGTSTKCGCRTTRSSAVTCTNNPTITNYSCRIREGPLMRTSRRVRGSPLTLPGFRHAYRRLRQGTHAASVRAAGRRAVRRGWHESTEPGQLPGHPRTRLRLRSPSGSAAQPSSRSLDVTAGTCALRIIISSSSYDPTGAIAGQAPTTAPIRPWPRP